MTKRTLVTLLVITLSFATGGLDTHTALASGPMVMAATPTDVREKIAPSVWNNTGGGRTMSFLVVLSSKADTRDAAGLRTKAEKGRYVYETKSRLAQATQAPLVSYLKSRGIAFRSFFIVNMLLVAGDRALVLELARRPDVERVVGNPTVRVALPTSDEAQASQGPDSLQAIEWGILNTNAPSIWELGNDGTGIVIGGEDTGYRWTHTQLRGKYRGWDGENADHNYNWHDAIHDSVGNPCGNDSPEPCDDNNHGSHTMGTMVGGDGPGPDPNDIGMAYGAKWIGCRNMDQGFGTPARYIECHEFMLAPHRFERREPGPLSRAARGQQLLGMSVLGRMRPGYAEGVHRGAGGRWHRLCGLSRQFRPCLLYGPGPAGDLPGLLECGGLQHLERAGGLLQPWPGHR